MRFGSLTIGRAIALFLLWSGLLTAAELEKRVKLSDEQQQWLAEHSPIQVGITPEWGPYSYFTANGQGAGIDVDVLNLISRRTGLKFQIIPAVPWERMWKMAQEGKLDMTTSTVSTPEREKVFTFTRAYGESSTVIVAREGDHRFSHVLQLRSAVIAQPKEHLVTSALQERLPDASVVLLETQRDCFERVLDGKADVTVADMYTAAQYLNDHPKAKLGISGVIPEFKFPLRLAVLRHYPILRDIMDQGLASISQQELDTIIASQLAFNLQGSRRADFLRRTVAGVIVLAAVIAAIFYLWNSMIRKEIRARRVAEAELRETNRSLEVFAHAVSHDLKTPLRAIRGFSEALREDYYAQLDQVGREYFARIISSVERMDGLISNVLAYSHASQAEFSLEAVSLKELVNQLVGEFPPEQRGYFHIVSELPKVRANPGLLGQSIANLLSNAVKFIPKERTPHIRIWSERQGSLVKLVVEDNGIGIAPEDQQRIFQLFQRAGPGSYAGTGIGLAVVAKGVPRMGGTVGVTSRPGEGSSFWIQLPVAD
ncbi:MAG: histidine kinase [Verrucomicrobiales bacterium]|nr:histidine kinase [Verrucomicrobiales bacterium]